ncbi:MAG: queuosine precursor transporter [Candidatus Thermoplasmatota archaeon]
MLWIGSILLCFCMVIAAYRLFGKNGLFVWMAVVVIVANIEVMKTVEIFGMVTALGNVVYSSLFLTTDILTENYSKKEAQKAVLIGFFVLICVTVLMQMTITFIPDESDFVSDHLSALFVFLPRITFASLTAYLVSQTLDVYLFAKLKDRHRRRYLWFRNNFSTFLSQSIDTSMFTVLAFVGVFSPEIILQIFSTSMIMKVVIGVCDTPFVYWARSLYEKKKMS